MRLPRLDPRLEAAYQLFEKCAWAADIGSDHGRLPLHLLAGGVIEHMVVSDISSSALQKGRKLLTLHGVDKLADFYVADGLCCLPRPMDFISVLGMGGETLCGILEAGREKLQGARLILSPHTGLDQVRRRVTALGYVFEKETLVYVSGRYYVIMRLMPGKAAYTDEQLYLGPCLTADRPALWQSYLTWRLKVLNAIKRSEPRIDWQRRVIEEALK